MKIGPKNSQSMSSAPSLEHKHKNDRNLTQHLLAGSVAGVMTTFAGHPLDTIKTRMQVLDDRFWSCCKVIVKKEGVLSLYKGIQSPLLSTPLTTAVSFGSYELSKRILGINKGKKVTFNQGLMAGGLAGFFYAAISTPIELVKCRLQMQDVGKQTKGKGSLNMIMNIIRKEGPIGLYRGYGITCLRDIPGGAIQFGAYELFKGFFNKKNNKDSTASNFVAGGLARFTSWFFCHPQDLIKTKLQCKTGYQGIVECSKEIWHRYGSIGFWRGSLPSIIRTLISGAVTFAVYEEAQTFFSKIC